MVSFSALLEAIEQTPSRTSEFLDRALQQPARLLSIPTGLRRLVEKKLSCLSTLGLLGADERQELQHLFTLAESATFNPDIQRSLLDAVWGPQLDALVERAAMVHPPILRRDVRVEPQLFKQTVHAMLQGLMSADHTGRWLGPVDMPRFDIAIHHGDDFAEYWPVALASPPDKGEVSRDRLVIFDNGNMHQDGVLRTTLAHEVLGHGVFYQSALTLDPPFFDHGAIGLIEGFATWCEWHASQSPHGRHFRYLACYGLRWVSEKNVDAVVAGLAEDARVSGFDRAATEMSLYTTSNTHASKCLTPLGRCGWRRGSPKKNRPSFLRGWDASRGAISSSAGETTWPG